MVGLALLTALVGRSRGSLVASDTKVSFDISLIVATRERFLILRVRLIAFYAARRTAIRPMSEASDVDAMFLTERSHHSTRILATAAHRSSTSYNALDSQQASQATKPPSFVPP
jgi:hypothetical protein